MFCVKCGVELADTEKRCPLCGTIVFHPDLSREETAPLYPPHSYPEEQKRSVVANVIVAVLFLLPILITLQCDLLLTKQITWSGYVIGGLVVAYVIFLLPGWFRRPNPVIFTPCAFAAIGAFLFFINFATDGNWFMTFAFPVTGFTMLVVTAVITLLRYTKHGEYYVIGGASLAFGLFMPVMEMLIHLTFEKAHQLQWSFYPLTVLVLFGGLMIFLGIYRPARDTMERKFFI